MINKEILKIKIEDTDIVAEDIKKPDNKLTISVPKTFGESIIYNFNYLLKVEDDAYHFLVPQNNKYHLEYNDNKILFQVRLCELPIKFPNNPIKILYNNLNEAEEELLRLGIKVGLVLAKPSKDVDGIKIVNNPLKIAKKNIFDCLKKGLIY